MNMKIKKVWKYKGLKFGQPYINQERSFIFVLVGGSKKKGYHFVGSHSHPSVILGDFYLLSRVVPNDGNWLEINYKTFNDASTFHVLNSPVFPDGNREVQLIYNKN